MAGLLDFLFGGGQPQAPAGGILGNQPQQPVDPQQQIGGILANVQQQTPWQALARFGAGLAGNAQGAQGGWGPGIAAGVQGATNTFDQAQQDQAGLLAKMAQAQANAASLAERKREFDRSFGLNEKKLAVSMKPNFTQIGEDMYGNKQFGFVDPYSGKVTPASGTGASSAMTDPNLTGDAFLASLPPPLADQVKAMVEGRLPVTNMRSPMVQKLLSYATQYEPGFDATKWGARYKTRSDFAAGGPNSAAGTITAGRTALQHLADLSDSAVSLDNFDTGLPGNDWLNAGRNAYNVSSGQSGPQQAFSDNAGKYAQESTKFYRGTGGSEADIERDLQPFSPNRSKSELAASLEKQLQLMEGKVNAMNQRWTDTMGPNAGQAPVIDKTTQDAITRLKGNIAKLRGEKSASNTPNWRPNSQADVDRALQEAKTAIAGGANVATVKARLKKIGIPTGSLDAY